MTESNKTMQNSGIVGGIIGGTAVSILFILIFITTPLIKSGQNIINNENITVSAIDVTDVVQEANPAVVSIVITQDVPIIERYFEDPFGGGPFSFQIPRYRQNGTEEQEVGGGSGFIISEDGYIVTNAHVVDLEDAEYTVFLTDERSFNAEVLAVDDVIDIAVLKIEAEDSLPTLEFGNSDELELGQGVIAIGNALGEYRNTVSTGVVSGLARSIVAGTGYGQSEALENVIQTDAAINPGNSGGPLIDFSGKVIGVNVAVAVNSENIGFAIPANVVSAAVDSIREHGKVIRPYLGVRYMPITSIVAEKNNLDFEYGALIIRGESLDELAVMPGSPADKAGLEENDIILEIDGTKVDEENQLSELIRNNQVGDIIKLKIMHDGEESTVSVTLEEMP
ncbi:MAG: trypsin-like peptidase domain-containing protein [Patescibacteria group bacterium]